MTTLRRRGLLAFGGLAAGTLAAPHVLRAQPAQSFVNIADTLAGDPRFSTFLDLVVHASMQDALRRPQPMTLFAPVNQAFVNAPALVLQDIRTLGQQRGSGGGSSGDSSDRQRWEALINYHIVPGVFGPLDLQGPDRRLRTLNGSDLRVSGSGNVLRVGNPAPSQQIGGFNAPTAHLSPEAAMVVGREVIASNGVIYPINQVLFP